MYVGYSNLTTNPTPCPHCGHCPTCGRTNNPTPTTPQTLPWVYPNLPYHSGTIIPPNISTTIGTL